MFLTRVVCDVRVTCPCCSVHTCKHTDIHTSRRVHKRDVTLRGEFMTNACKPNTIHDHIITAYRPDDLFMYVLRKTDGRHCDCENTVTTRGVLSLVAAKERGWKSRFLREVVCDWQVWDRRTERQRTKIAWKRGIGDRVHVDEVS